jgi:hypothetical protein
MKKVYLSFTFSLLLFISQSLMAQNGERVGTPKTGNAGITETVAQIMARDVPVANIICKHAEVQLQDPDRTNLAQNPLAPDVPFFPYNTNAPATPVSESPQTLGTNFTAATLSGTNPTG